MVEVQLPLPAHFWRYLVDGILLTLDPRKLRIVIFPRQRAFTELRHSPGSYAFSRVHPSSPRLKSKSPYQSPRPFHHCPNVVVLLPA